MSAAVELRSLTKRFGATTALDSISLVVERGEMFGVIGPDGAGKSTLLRSILGLLAADMGSVRTCGFDPGNDAAQLVRRVGYVAQGASLYDDLSVDENLSFFARIQGSGSTRAQRLDLLAQLELEPFRKRLAGRLSGGMRRKLALACTLLHDPDLLVLDEPTTGVDPVSRRDFWSVLTRIRSRGMTVLLSTPSLDEAERCGRVAFLHRGRLLEVDTPERLRAAEAEAMLEIVATPRRKAAELLRARAAVLRVLEVETFGERLHVTLAEVPAGKEGPAMDAIASDLRGAGIDLPVVRPIRPSLEDVFLRRMRRLEAAS